MDPQKVCEEVAKAPPRPHEVAKAELEFTVRRVVSLIRRDRDKALRAIAKEQRKITEEAAQGDKPNNVFLPSMQEILAKKMYDGWSSEERRGVEVWEGFCFLSRTQWFVVAGDPQVVLEPVWDYIIDPLSSGVLLFGDDGRLRPTSALVISPMSPWTNGYSGMPEYLVREQEAQDTALRAQQESQR